MKHLKSTEACNTTTAVELVLHGSQDTAKTRVGHMARLDTAVLYAWLQQVAHLCPYYFPPPTQLQVDEPTKSRNAMATQQSTLRKTRTTAQQYCCFAEKEIYMICTFYLAAGP